MAFLPGMGGGSGGIGNGLIRIGANTTGLRSDVRNAVRSVRSELEQGAQQVNASQKRWNAAFSAIGMAAKVGLIGVVGAAAGAVGAAMQFETSWAGVRKTLDATPAELAVLRQQFRDLAKEIPVSVNELAKIGATAGALGIAKQDILEFTRVVATIGSTTNVSTDEAATAIGQLGNVLHLSGKDYSRFASTLVDLGNKGASTEQQILKIASRAGSSAALIHMSTQAMLGFASATASLGIEVEAGGSSLQNFFLIMGKAVGSGGIISKLASQTGVTTTKFIAMAGAGAKSMKVLEARTGQTSQAIKQAVKNAQTLDEIGKIVGMSGAEYAKFFGKDSAKALDLFIHRLGDLSSSEQLAALNALKMNNTRIIRTLLGLAGNADLLTTNLNNAAHAWDANTAAQAAAKTRWETTAAQITILKNLFHDYLITLGDLLLPAVKDFLTLLSTGLPKAIAFLGAIWKTTLQPPIEAFGKALGDLITAFGGLFGSDGEGGTKKAANWGGVIGGALQGVANGFAQILKLATPLLKVLTAIVSNPFGAWVIRIAAAITTMRVGLGLFNQLVGRAKGFSGTIGRLIGIGGGTPGTDDTGAVALKGSAKNLDSSATALKEAATAIQRGAAGQLVAGEGSSLLSAVTSRGPIDYSGPAGRLGGSIPAGARAEGNNILSSAGAWLAVGNNPTDRGAYEQYKNRISAAGKGLLQRAGADLADGIANAGRTAEDVKNAVRSRGQSLLHYASQVFWPLMIADIATEVLKAPIGGFIESNTKFKRAGAEMKNDFFGGLADLLTSISVNSDEWIGHKSEMTIGNAVFKTLALAQIGIKSATFTKLEAPVGTIEHAQGVDEAGTKLANQLGQNAGESALDWYKRVANQLPEATQAAIRKFIGTGRYGQFIDPQNEQAVKDLLTQASGAQVANLRSTTDTEWAAAVRQALLDRGFTTGQIAGLSTDQRRKIGAIVQSDLSGQYGFLTDLVVQSFIGQSGAAKPTLSVNAAKAQAQIKKALGKNWATEMLTVLSGKPQGAGEKETAKALAAALGKNWQEIIRSVYRELHPERPQYAGTDAQNVAANLKAQANRVGAAIGDWYRNVPKDIADGIDQQIAASGETDPAVIEHLRQNLIVQWHNSVNEGLQAFEETKSLLSPKVATTLSKRFGKDWVVAFRDGAQVLGTSKPDTAVKKELARVFGKNWAATLQGVGQLVFAKEGGADFSALKTMLASAIQAQIKGLTKGDLTGGKHDTTTPEKDRKAIATYLTSTVGQAAIDAAASPDAQTAKKGFSDLGNALKKSIPDADARKRFIDSVVALQKAATAPGLPTLQSVLATGIPKAASDVVSLATGVGTLNDRVREFLHLLGLAQSTGPVHGSATNRLGGRIPGATGLLFDTRGETQLTVGEAGKEHVAVLRNPRRMPLGRSSFGQSIASDLMAGLARTARTNPRALPFARQGEGMGGPRVQVLADKLQLFTDGQRRSVDAQLEFLAPGGR